MNCVKSSIECVWSNLKMASLSHGSGFKVRKIPKKMGVDFIHYNGPKAKEVGDRYNDESKIADITIGISITLSCSNSEERVDRNGQGYLFNDGETTEFLLIKNEDIWRNSFRVDESIVDEGCVGAEKLKVAGSGVVDSQIVDISSQFVDNNAHTIDFGSNIEISTPDIAVAGTKMVDYDQAIDLDDLLSTGATKFLDSEIYLTEEESDAAEQALDQDQELTLNLTPFSGCRTWIPGVELSDKNLRFLHAFVNGFIPSISPQHCHPRITPKAIFMSQGITEPMMRDVFYACGAAFMANGNKNMLTVARRRYADCLSMFANRLSATGGHIEEWMVAAALLFTLRDKFVGSTPEHPITHLAKAVELIRILRQKTGDESITLKFFVDSFLFNYSVVLITGGNLAMKILPSPFEIFDEWRLVYEYQPFQCLAPWMNNPVFGAATKAFELAAKASWLVHKWPLKNDDMVIACDLLAESYKLQLPPIVTQRAEELSTRDFRHVQQSVAVSEGSKLSCQLLLLRLMNPTLELLHEIVGSRVRDILQILRNMSPDSSLWVICSWLLLITGLCAELPEDREFVILNCNRAAHLFRAEFMKKTGIFLEKSWGTSDLPGPGWNIIFDSPSFHTLCL